jgi:hypothetical protein
MKCLLVSIHFSIAPFGFALLRYAPLRAFDSLPGAISRTSFMLWLVKLVAHHERAKRVEWWAILDLNQ